MMMMGICKSDDVLVLYISQTFINRGDDVAERCGFWTRQCGERLVVPDTNLNLVPGACVFVPSLILGELPTPFALSLLYIHPCPLMFAATFEIAAYL